MSAPGGGVVVASVNLGQPREMGVAGKRRFSGIFKEPVAGAVAVNELGLAGDHVLDVKHHGGPGQAVYMYTLEDYAWWSVTLGRPLPPGEFGENLTISGLDIGALRVGDFLHFDNLSVQFTTPRRPCATLAARMNDLAFVRRFREARRPGVYARVTRPGSVQAGQIGRLEPWPEEAPGILERFDLAFEPPTTPEAVRRLLAAPLDERSRAEYESLLAQLTGQ